MALHTSMGEVDLPPAAIATLNRNARALAMAEATVIESQDDANRVAGDIRTMRSRREELTEQLGFVLAPALATVARLKALFQPTLDGIDAADKVLRSKLLSWNDAEAARVRRERAEAEERQRAERQRAEAAAAEERRRAQVEEKRLLDEAHAAREAGNAEAEARAREEASNVIENAEAVAASREMEASASVVVVDPAAVAAGTGGRNNWRAKSIDDDSVRKIVTAIAGGRAELLALLMINGPAANAKARAEKQYFDVPGMRAVNTRTTIVR